MDGNGRWATQQGLPRMLGHRAGADAVRRIAEACCEIGIRYLTLYAFSWENWSRPSEEIQELMRLLNEFLEAELPALHANGIRLRAMGRLQELPADVFSHLQEIMARTERHDRLTMTLALSYGGRQELVDAARAVAQEVAAGRLRPEEIDEACLARHLYLPELPDPDLLIRTSGEQRVSNFLLWQGSYCELYMTPTLWPDFTKDDLLHALFDYHTRQRRFGKTADAA